MPKYDNGPYECAIDGECFHTKRGLEIHRKKLRGE